MNPHPTTFYRAVHRPSSRRTLKFPPRATDADIRVLLTGPALRRLEPQPGGRWTLESRAHESILVKYWARDGIELVHTCIHLAANSGTAADLCWQHVYGYQPGQMVVVANVPRASRRRFLNLEAPGQSHVHGQPHVGSNIHDTMPPTSEFQSLGLTSAGAPTMHPMPQFLPPQHIQAVDGIEGHHQQMQHAADAPASWALSDASMAQPSQAPSAGSSPTHQVESDDEADWDWTVYEENE